MHFFMLLLTPVWVVAALALVKYLDLGLGLTLTLAVGTVLLGIVGIAWFAAKDSAARDGKNTVSKQVA